MKTWAAFLVSVWITTYFLVLFFNSNDFTPQAIADPCRTHNGVQQFQAPDFWSIPFGASERGVVVCRDGTTHYVLDDD